MAFIVWDEMYATGVASLDEQHKHLISLLNRMIEAIAQKKGKEELSYVIEEMGNYATTHFQAEETLMEKAGYSELEEHRLFHDAFIAKVDDFRLKYDACDEGLTAEVTIFLTNWLNEHLSIVNQEYIPFLKKVGKI